MENIKNLADAIRAAKSIAVLTGAGISTGSGIPDFRSASGIYSDTKNVNVFDLSAFKRDPSIYYNFAKTFYPQVRDAKPNSAHQILAKWQNEGKQICVITQNVDDYHQRAGSAPVYTVHGNYIQSTCQKCGATTETEDLFEIIERGEIPHCICGGVYKPDITFFGEMLPEYDWSMSVKKINEADLVLVIGTSLSVYPAASLPEYRAPTAKLAIINRDSTHLDNEAEFVINDEICAVLEQTDALL